MACLLPPAQPTYRAEVARQQTCERPAVAESYRVPKHPVPIKLRLAWQEPKELSLYVAKHAARHTGAEYPSDLLNGGDRFLPALDEEGRYLVFQRSQVMVLSVSAEYEKDLTDLKDAGEEAVTTLDIELILEDGTRVQGAVSYWRPQGQRRFQDYLNSAEEFIPVREGDTIHLVNRERIVFASTD
jgi:hypothetical protein